MDTNISKRKADHLRIVAEENVTHARGTLLNCVELVHNALPELALADIDISTEFFGKQLHAPLMIASMTGGAERTAELNRDLAGIAAELGIAFAVGSQRAMLAGDDCLADFAVREHIPDGVLLGNIGAQQLRDVPAEQIAALGSRIEADGLCVHLNCAHELAQDEGDRDFCGLLDAIATLAERLDGRVLVKETGAGISPDVARRLAARGVRYIDIAGAGGTSWPKVEQFRSVETEASAVGETFADWGIPTAACIIGVRQNTDSDVCIIGSGGITTGLDAARGIACGADIIGIARPVLLAYIEHGAAGAKAYLMRIIHEMKTAMLLTSSRDIAALQRAPRIYTGVLKDWLAAEAWNLGQGEHSV